MLLLFLSLNWITYDHLHKFCYLIKTNTTNDIISVKKLISPIIQQLKYYTTNVFFFILSCYRIIVIFVKNITMRHQSLTVICNMQIISRISFDTMNIMLVKTVSVLFATQTKPIEIVMFIILKLRCSLCIYGRITRLAVSSTWIQVNKKNLTWWK